MGVQLVPVANIRPYTTDREKVAFAKEFLRKRTSAFKKDIEICLTPNNSGSHAYFPALITCISFMDFLSGLYAGTMRKHGFEHFLSFATAFMDSSKYRNEDMEILYEGFRHKIAHLGHPYFVFDTDTSTKLNGKRRRRLVTWTVYAARRAQPLEVVHYQTIQTPKKSISPWPVYFDSRLCISVRSFATDIAQTLRGPRGFIERLQGDASLRAKFTECMRALYPN